MSADVETPSIRVTPAVGEFSDVEPGMVFVIPFTIHNVSNKVKRVRFAPPKTSAFRLINTQQSIAPGMKQNIEVEFSSKEIKEYHDTLVVRTEGGEITIPLHAWFPAPNLVFDPVVDLGRVSSQHPVESKKLRIRNIGKKDGVFKFVVEPHLTGLSITPQHGVVAAGHEIEASVHYFATDVGLFRGVVNLQVEGQPVRRVEVLADVVESRVAVLDPHSMEPTSRLSFGKLFFGQRKQAQILLRNYGQHTCSFTVRPPEDLGNAADEESQHLALPMECTPTEGRIGGNESCLVTFSFAPVMIESQRGWEHSSVSNDDLAREWDVPFCVEIVETEQKLDVQLFGKALPTQVRLSESSFRFPDCPVNDHCDVLFSFTNESSELPVAFALSRVAHFRCSPNKGTLPPKAQQNITLTFHPNQLGAFRAVMNLAINGGSKVFPITVMGCATSIAPKPKLVGGVDKIEEDFIKPTKFAQTAPRPPLTFLNPMAAQDTADADDFQNHLSSAGGGADQAPDLLLMSEWQQKREHNRLYNNFVQNSRNIRVYNERMKKGMMVDTNPDDIGMIPAEGMEGPEPRIPAGEDPLPWSGGTSDPEMAKKGEGAHMLRKALKVDENKIVKKKFRTEPLTLSEIRECKLVLSPKDIQNIVIPVKVLDFQQVSVYSTNKKSFFVFNGLKTHILVNIPLGIRDELAQSTPTSQVIPPGQIAGFDIVFRSETAQTFQQAIYFTINETHKLKFVVFAEAIPIELQLSHSELQFRFTEFGYEPSVTLPLTMSNPGNSAADFQWGFPAGDPGAFSFAPATGTVPANSSLTVNVTYTPVLASNETQCEAVLKVKGGVAQKKLSLFGAVQAASCTWNVKDNRVDFKKLPVGSTRTQTITLKNTGATSAVFAFDTSQLVPGVSVAPLRGRIAAGASEEVQIQLRATTSQVIKTALSCHIRGMKQLLKMQLLAEAKVPEFYIQEPAESASADSTLDFGGVYVGSTELRKMVITSHESEIISSFAIDLREFPAFALYDSDKRLVDVAVAEDDEIPAGSAGQIAVLRTKSDDDEYDGAHQGRGGGGASGAGDDDDAKGKMYRVSIAPRAVFTFYVAFAPQSVGSVESFVLPLSLLGSDITSPAMRPVVVSAEGKKPRLVLTPLVDFGSRVVVRDGTSKVPNRILVKLSNETDGELQWEIDTKSAEHVGDVFRVEPTAGVLQPGHESQVQFTFTPLEVRSYIARYAVHLDGNRNVKYMEITTKGFGSNPSLNFDRKEVILPPVPLDVPSKLTFFIGNDGYESLDLRYKIAGDGKLPLSVAFPDGQTITSNHSQLPVEVTFLSKKPITFTVNIDFFDDADGIFSIPVTCCADNSLLTTYAYVKWRDAGAAILAEGDRKPLVWKESDDTPIDKETPRAGAKSDTASNTGGEDSVGAFHALDTVNKKTLSIRTLERLRMWININVVPEPVTGEMLGALQANNGRLLLEIIEMLFGKPPLGASGAAKGSGGSSVATGGAAAGGKKESVLQMAEQYDAVLLFLKQYGACVSEVRSEFLLRYEDYCRVLELQAQGARQGAGGGVAAKSKAHLNLKRFNGRALHAWTTVLFQVIKVFYCSRITWRALRSLPATPVSQTFSQLEKWPGLAQEPSSVGSNLYSVPEALLLKWLSMHLTAVFGKAAERPLDPKKREATGGVELKEYLRVTNFESDLRDCKAFAACVMTYIPTLAARFDPTKDTGLVVSAATAMDLERNASLLLEAMKEFGMDLAPMTPRDFLDSSGRDNMLFAAYLFNTLPQYVPKTTVKFKGKLNDTITKSIELTNPTKWPIDYTVTLDGSEDFKLPDNKFHLEPRSSGSFAIECRPRFSRKVEGRCMFLSNRGGTFSAATMIFALETDVDPDSSRKVFDALETTMYDALNYEVAVENPFPVAGHFTVHIYQEYLRDANAKPYPEEESLHTFPDAFWSSTDTLSLKKNDKGKFVLQFLPCVRGKYKARVVFRDEKVGEFAYAFYGTCLPPKPFDVINVQTEATQQISREVLVPLRHLALEKALQQKEERFKVFKGGARKGAGAKDAELEGKEVSYRVDFLNDKFVGPNPFFSGPRTFHLKSGGAAGDDDAAQRKKDKAAEKGSQGGLSFPVTFNPKGPGTYNCIVLLSSPWDVRVVAIEAKSRSPGMRAELEFACPARQQISQEIPITNGSEKEWVISAQLQGDGFSGPREVRVPAGRSRNYTLVFNPNWICDVTGQLVLRNSDTQEKYTYVLRGKAEEPLAENTIPVECKARETRKITINVPNITFDEVTYNVETDLPFVSGDPRITVGKMEVGRYVLHISPQLSGKTTGSITFTAPNKHYVWFVVQVSVLRPPPEDTIAISAEVRKGAVAEIGISNPTNRIVDFTVRRRGEGLHGDDIITLEPHQTNAIYQLAFAPTKAGDYDGVISFNNDDIGEFWYRLNLHAKEAAPAQLTFQCELGKSTSTEVVIENPTDSECTMSVANTNEVNFSVTPPTLVLRPRGTLKALITYMPSAIHGAQEGTIQLSHGKAGTWEYRCKGSGLPPTKMETVHCSSHVGRTASISVMFRNPFPVPKRFLATLRTEPGAQGVFSLMQKKQSSNLGPFQIMQIPVAYSPSLIAEHHAAVVVQLMEQVQGDLRWEFPLKGVAEATSSENTPKLVVKSRKAVSQVCAFPLIGLTTSMDDEEFTSELVIAADIEYRRAAVNSINVARVGPERYGSRDLPADAQHIFYEIQFAPLRPFAITAELLVRKASGGMWRFPVQLEAVAPEPDDVIVIEAAVNVVATVTFQLYNVLPFERDFVAYFTPESPQEFSVAPAKGTLPPMPSNINETRKAGQQIAVNFTSSQYGKTLVGHLIVDTDDMQWRYEVRGTLPKYQPPTNVRSKVQNRLRPETELAVKKANSKILPK